MTYPARGARAGVLASMIGSAGFALIALVTVLGCASLPRPFEPAPCPARLVDLGRLLRGRVLHARVETELYGRDSFVEVVAEAGEDGLVVVGLSPHHGRLFVIRQVGEERVGVEADTTGKRLLAHAVFDALHRAYWASPDATSPEDWFDWYGERARDHVGEAGIEREFYPGDGTKRGAVVRFYPPDASQDQPGSRAARAEITHDACHYDATVWILDEGESRPRS